MIYNENTIGPNDQYILLKSKREINKLEKKLVIFNIVFCLLSVILLFLIIFKIIGTFICIKGTYFYEISNNGYIIGTSLIFTIINYFLLVFQYTILLLSFIFSIWLFFLAKSNGYEGWIVFSSAAGFISAVSAFILSMFELFFSPFTASFSICILLLTVSLPFYFSCIGKSQKNKYYHIILINDKGN